ncbi:TSUP family transporter [Mesoplasma lactucae]|uniref:Probable membrane transporter protein n=1 Tax=Mesoplasma lactucae ATCC 49193 TaxID=81460 RepID=A0A291IR52_9MOLU|nr:TSUP family transporter [Mesoplasma lactucae]ATG97218.1 hypothetical protein CP520_00360 [Mesoplasma lactucae ATCC 49193]ATZ20340.1 hypothetical protein MLACT_v1c05190 [Mesoplasma lactucae ATCC 49193]MCL8216511.1 hypothetical protein [Mesoplasma lactucae ATCC 49193]
MSVQHEKPITSLSIESEHWNKLLELERDIDEDNINIQNNFKALNAIDHLQSVQLKELRSLYRQNVISKDEFKEQKEVISKNAEDSKNEILDELSYNTSFIVAKYQELTDLQQHDKIKEINKKFSRANRKINHKIKHEKRQAKREMNKVVKTYEKNNMPEAKIDELRNTYQTKQLEKQEKLMQKQEVINQGFIKSSRSASYQAIMITLVISVPVLLLIGLLVNYFYYVPQTNKFGNDSLWTGGYGFQFTSHTIPGFIICMLSVALVIGFTWFLIKKSTKRIVIDRNAPTGTLMSIGFLASFFDMMGIGSFASSLAMFKTTKSIKDDSMIPGTTNVAFCVPNTMEAAFLTAAVDTNIVSLVVLVLCAMVGSYFGATIVKYFDAQRVKLVMGSILIIAAIVMILTTPQVALIGAAKEGAKGIIGWRWAVAVPAFLLIGVLMAFGIGSYAPSLLVLSLLGMSTIYCTPIMTCSSAFVMPVTSYKFYKDNNYLPKTSLAVMLGGIFGSTISFLFFYCGLIGSGTMKSDGVAYTSIMKWLTVAVMFYSSFTMLFGYFKNRKAANEQKENEKKTNKRQPLGKIRNKANLTNEIRQQYLDTLNKYKNSLDTKEIVEKENLPKEEWVKNPNSDKREPVVEVQKTKKLPRVKKKQVKK